jgi:hypothetical protein
MLPKYAAGSLTEYSLPVFTPQSSFWAYKTPNPQRGNTNSSEIIFFIGFYFIITFVKVTNFDKGILWLKK